MDDTRTVRLTDDQRDALQRELTIGISTSPYNNFEQFEEQSSELILNELPKDIRKSIQNLRKKKKSRGSLLIKNLPIDQTLIDTPTTSQFDPNEKRTFQTEAISVGCANLIGEPFGYINEKGGQVVHNNFPTKAGKNTISNEGSTVILPWHVEDIHVAPYHPDWVSLMCLRGCRDYVAETLLLQSKHIVKELDRETIDHLFQPLYFTTPPQSFGGEADGTGELVPIFSGAIEEPILRVEFTDTRAVTLKAQKALDTLKEKCMASDYVQRIVLEAGDLLVFDNRTNLHSRTNYPTYFDGNDRWLQRLFIKEGSMVPWAHKLLKDYYKILSF